MESLKKIIRKLDDIKIDLNRVDEDLYEMNGGFYWVEIASKAEREARYLQIYKNQRNLLNKKHTLLENLKGEAQKELMTISSELRELNLITNK